MPSILYRNTSEDKKTYCLFFFLNFDDSGFTSRGVRMSRVATEHLSCVTFTLRAYNKQRRRCLRHQADWWRRRSDTTATPPRLTWWDVASVAEAPLISPSTALQT